MERTKVVFISGSGRTGSTLLSLLLSQGVGTWNVGQIRDLPKAAARNAPCTCGVPVTACGFWSSVIAENGLAELGADREAIQLRQKFVRSNPWVKLSEPDGASSIRHPYLDHLREIYGSTIRAAPGRVLIDSSKTPEMALALSLLPELDVTVIHLQRDPRAVACSWHKKLRDRKRVVAFSRVWKERHRALRAWAAHPTCPVINLRYEELASRPRESLREVCERVGLRGAEEVFTDERTAGISWERQHLFPPANEGVLARKETTVTIRPAEAWKAPVNLGLHLLALWHTFPEGWDYCFRPHQPEPADQDCETNREVSGDAM